MKLGSPSKQNLDLIKSNFDAFGQFVSRNKSCLKNIMSKVSIEKEDEGVDNIL